MIKKPPYTNRIVAFIDILGFKSLISSLPENVDLHSKLYTALSYIKYYKDLSCNEDTSFNDLEVNTFSDSIVISSEEKNIDTLIYTCGCIQSHLLYLGILTRGGISSGYTVHNDNILYGDGMIKAYDLESKCAIYPRILIDESLLQILEKCENGGLSNKSFLEKDYDGMWFVNPFKFDTSSAYSEELLSEGYDPRETYFSEIKNHVKTSLEKEKNNDILMKLKWLQSKLEIASNEYIQNRNSNNFFKTKWKKLN